MPNQIVDQASGMLAKLPWYEMSWMALGFILCWLSLLKTKNENSSWITDSKNTRLFLIPMASILLILGGYQHWGIFVPQLEKTPSPIWLAPLTFLTFMYCIAFLVVILPVLRHLPARVGETLFVIFLISLIIFVLAMTQYWEIFAKARKIREQAWWVDTSILFGISVYVYYAVQMIRKLHERYKYIGVKEVSAKTT